MSETFLDRIIKETRKRVGVMRGAVDASTLRGQAEDARARRQPHCFRKALERTDRPNIIAEIKRASPSKGTINDRIDVSATAGMYERNGAAAISVLTEEMFFKGTIDDLKQAREAVEIPILRKDFIIDELQIFEAAASGADAVLLIVAALTSDDLQRFRALAGELGLDALVEVHTASELEIASEIGADLIGINNRNLKTFDVSLDVSRELIRRLRTDALMIAESGISSREQIDELRALGFNGFLVGESLMRPGSISKLSQFVG